MPNARYTMAKEKKCLVMLHSGETTRNPTGFLVSHERAGTGRQEHPATKSYLRTPWSGVQT